MAVRSAALLLYRRRSEAVEVLLVHPGGAFWSRRDAGWWSIPKGEYLPGEDPAEAAVREFSEETGHAARGVLRPLGDAVQPGRKIVTVFAVEGDLDATEVKSNTFEMEWPRGSGRRRSFPEIDRAAWFTPVPARLKILPGQAVFLDRLASALA